MPWTVLMSAGLMGAARVRRRTEEEGTEGEMECLWMLWRCQCWLIGSAKGGGKVVGCWVAYRRASFGSPYSEKTRAFACVYPYGPDIHLLCAPRRVRGAATRADPASAGRRPATEGIALADMVADV